MNQIHVAILAILLIFASHTLYAIKIIAKVDVGHGNAVFISGENDKIGGYSNAFRLKSISADTWEYEADIPIGSEFRLLRGRWKAGKIIPVQHADWEQATSHHVTPNPVIVHPQFDPQSTIRTVNASASTINYNIINLEKSTARKIAMTKQFSITDITNYRFVPAVDGKKVDRSNLPQKGLDDKNPLGLTHLRDGEIGIYLSTTQAILPWAISKPNEITVVFEDDVIIPIDLDEQLRKALKGVPADWDILYLGCNQYNFTDAEGRIAGPFAPMRLPEFASYEHPLCPNTQKNRIEGTPWVKLNGSCTPGTWAYALDSNGASKLLRLLTPIRRAIDVRIRELIASDKINAYCLNPELVRTREDTPSTIR